MTQRPLDEATGPTVSAVRALLAEVGRRAPTLGGGRLVCIDGPAGAGKTTLARLLGELAGCPVVHLDDLYAGWSGLATVEAGLATLLEPLAEGAPGRYRRYDWHAEAFAKEVRVEPAPLLVLEGVGSGAARFAHLVTLLVWVDAPQDLRRQRGIARDGDVFATRWDQWARDESALFARERTRERADERLDGVAGA